LLAPPRDGGTYAVVLEKQAGASGKYHIEVSAPVGFRWKENGLPVFEYETDNLPGRLVLDLTFEKVAD
jgi:predicted lipoprotein with Yx(FWY)xxD motif